MTNCPTAGELVKARIDRVLTQYRESPRLLHLLKTYLSSIADAHLRACQLPEHFELETAVGDQLTIIGKRLGWPRNHCVCVTQPTFGFDCKNQTAQVEGFCDDQVVWGGCYSSGVGTISINDDELYRRFLKSRRYQIRSLYSKPYLEAAIRDLWGDAAKVLDAGRYRAVVCPGRDLTSSEIATIQLYPRVMPIALGVEVKFHFDAGPVFGFGRGWDGFCVGSGIEELDLFTDLESSVLTDADVNVILDEYRESAHWMCEFDVKPYSC